MTIFDSSTNPDRVPFPGTLRAIAELARRTGVDVLLVGATARDVALAAEGHDSVTRATKDVDIAVAVADHQSYVGLVTGLDRARNGNPHKFLVQGVEVDIIAFGGIEREDRTIEWPDGTQLNTLGFAEALWSALELRLPDGLTLAVASLSAQVALKIFAWGDRGHWTSRDAVDLRTLLHAFSEGRRLDDIYADQHFHLLETYDFEVRAVGAHLLGIEVRRDLGDTVAARCVDVIDEDRRGPQHLGAAMRGDIEENLLLLDALVAGAQPPAGPAPS